MSLFRTYPHIIWFLAISRNEDSESRLRCLHFRFKFGLAKECCALPRLALATYFSKTTASTWSFCSFLPCFVKLSHLVIMTVISLYHSSNFRGVKRDSSTNGDQVFNNVALTLYRYDSGTCWNHCFGLFVLNMQYKRKDVNVMFWVSNRSFLCYEFKMCSFLYLSKRKNSVLLA